MFIKGPPGCGKTFLGVKIVQLLLSLSPKLEKPILLLTYKNHALDEFLKHMLEFCSIQDMVRIGGRSKEPELETCNLKYLMVNCDLYPETQVEIQNRREIEDIEEQIQDVLEEVETSSYLTESSLVDELSEEQIKSLILEAGKESIPATYRLNRNFDSSTWTKQLLNDISETHSSVKEFLQEALEIGVSDNEVDIACIEVFDKALTQWFPDLKELQTMKEFQAESILRIESDTISQDDMSTSRGYQGGDNDYDSEEEDYVNQLLEMRMCTGGKQEFRSNSPLISSGSESENGDILVSISDFSGAIAVNTQIRFQNSLWSLDEVKRLKFLYSILNKKITRVYQELNDLIERLKSLKNVREEFENNKRVEMLSKKKIIGVTITGASINHDLLHDIGPSVVIVEEAAEILEPSLLAALSPSIEHLILIGDHKQLRPQVDTYELCKTFRFDKSMMERLIDSGFPYKRLTKQNRMRPEFSALLHDIYPDLKDNLPLVSKNEPLKCIEKSMFFWCHDDPEKKDRTYTNIKEAERITALVMYLLWNGVRPSEITVLAAYLGQTKLLRNKMKQEKANANNTKFFQEIDERGIEREGFVQVQTIDMYQGDENKYVVVSLVRSNKENRIGFLKAMNRRCVAQSRAKCGMYFVGNINTMCGAKGSCWSEFISLMKKQGCVGYEFPLQCTKHKTTKYKAIDGDCIRAVNAKHELLCNQPCGDPYPECDKHPCKKSCFPRHHHMVCPELVNDQFPDCKHDVQRKCPQKISDYRCQTIVNVDLPCKHEGEKKCCQNVKDVICSIPVTATFLRCGHKTEKPCHVKIEDLKCQYPCKEMNSCGIHQCKKVCGENHGHETCSELIDYNFPNCGHPSSEKKPCSKEITWKCKYKVSFQGSCGHEIQRECHQSENEVKCPVTPCGRKRKCKHPCTNACGDDCEKGDCKHCQAVYEEKMKAFRKAAQDKYYELEESMKKKEIPKFSRHELHDTGPTAAEYRKVNDQVLNFIKPCHLWFPTITKIEKVTNLELEQKFEAAKFRAFGDYIDTKFHGTSNEGVKSIITKGFKMPEANPSPPNKRGMYGQGIYFATDSSKSAKGISTKGSQKLLLCQVILGKSLTVEKADNTLNKRKLKLKKCDSVYAPRGTQVINDEFVIFDPDQALPQYIIHFSSTNNFVPPSPTSLTTHSYFKKNMTASRTVNFQDPFEMFYNFAESHFRRMAASSKPPQSKATISSIDIVINKDLEDKFEATKKTFQSQGIPDKEILAYHGTDPNNIDSILKSNLQLSYAKRQAYGKGNYFSEFPAVSLGYGQGLLLCRILPGKEYVDSTNCDIPQEYNSKKVLKSQLTGVSAANASGDMIIIENSDQILPFFVIHR